MTFSNEKTNNSKDEFFEHLLVAVVGLFVVAAESDDGSEARSQREEDLRGSVDPQLDLEQATPVLDAQVERNAEAAALQCQAAYQQDEHDYVRCHCSDPHSLYYHTTTNIHLSSLCMSF